MGERARERRLTLTPSPIVFSFYLWLSSGLLCETEKKKNTKTKLRTGLRFIIKRKEKKSKKRKLESTDLFIRKYESLFKLSDVTEKRFRSEKLRRCCVNSPETIAALYHGPIFGAKNAFLATRVFHIWHESN